MIRQRAIRKNSHLILNSWAFKNTDPLTTTEAAKAIGFSRKPLLKAFDEGRLKGFRVPGSRFRRILSEGLVEYINIGCLEDEKSDLEQLSIRTSTTLVREFLRFLETTNYLERFEIKPPDIGDVLVGNPNLAFNPLEKRYTSIEAENLLGISSMTVNRYFDSSRLEGVRIMGSKHRLISADSLAKFIAKNNKDSTQIPDELKRNAPYSLEYPGHWEDQKTQKLVDSAQGVILCRDNLDGLDMSIRYECSGLYLSEEIGDSGQQYKLFLVGPKYRSNGVMRRDDHLVSLFDMLNSAEENLQASEISRVSGLHSISLVRRAKAKLREYNQKSYQPASAA